jgi:hypothetical protein
MLCHKPQVVSKLAIEILLSKITLFEESVVISHISPLIYYHAMQSRMQDLNFILPIFIAWINASSFNPKPHVKPNFTHNEMPVKEFLDFGGKTFSRPRFCLGVRFATILLMGSQSIGVAWTTDRKALIFKYIRLYEWKLDKTLNRQDDPFHTWLRHLGGQQRVEDEMNKENGRSAEELFNDLIVPYFGTHKIIYRRFGLMGRTHPIWGIIRQASYATFHHDAKERFEWELCDPYE